MWSGRSILIVALMFFAAVFLLNLATNPGTAVDESSAIESGGANWSPSGR
jgi:hypothetical protein